MADTFNAILAALVLGGLALRLAQTAASRDAAGNARAAAHAGIGVGLFGYIVAPVSGEVHPGAQTALLVGLAVLLLVRWRRRSES